MLDEYKKAEELLKYTLQTLSLIIDNDGEDITCYYAETLDPLIIDLVKARSFMSIADISDILKTKKGN